MSEEVSRGKFRLAVALYWFCGVFWGYLILKLPDFWFLVGVVISSLVCGYGGWYIEKLVQRIVNEHNS